MLYIKNDIKDKIYYGLMFYAFMRCDVVTFHLPNFNKRVINEKNKDVLFENLDFGVKEKKRDNHDYSDYLDNIEELLADFKKNILYEYKDVEYVGSIYGHECDIKVISLSSQIVFNNLMGSGRLYDWKYPELPEDLCLFSKGKCWLQSIAHEELCFIYTDDPLEMKILKKIGLKFLIVEDDEVPTLKYTLKY